MTGSAFLSDKPRLREVMRETMRTFGRRRPKPADPDSRRNCFNAMCCRCEWQREGSTSQGASGLAMKHGQDVHGDAFVGFVRVECR